MKQQQYGYEISKNHTSSLSTC